MFDLGDLLITALTAGTGLFVTGWIKRWYERRLAATDLARSALIDVLLTLRSIEAQFDSLMELPGGPRSREELIASASAWSIGTPVLSCELLLAGLDHEPAHAEAILFFDQLANFDAASREHERAYFWLLDDAPIDERSTSKAHVFDDQEPRTKERLDALRVTRRRLQGYALGALRHGYRLVCHLSSLAERWTSTRIADEPHIEETLRERFALTLETVAARARYYQNGRVSHVFSDAEPHRLAVLGAVPQGLGFCALEWTRTDGKTCEIVVNLTKRDPIMLPARHPVRARVHKLSSGQWIQLPVSAVSFVRSPATAGLFTLEVSAEGVQRAEADTEAKRQGRPLP